MLYDQETKVPVKGVMTPAKYEGTTGIKTGYTPQAGASLVSGAQRDGTELIAVVLASADVARYGDSIALLEYGFENYYTYKAVDSGIQLEDVAVMRGAFNSVSVKIQEDRYITLPKQASLSLISTNIVMDDNVTAPIEAGQALGRLEIYEGSDLIDEVPIIAASDIEEGMFLSIVGIEDSVSEKIIKYAIIAGGIATFLILAYVILTVSYERRRKARRRARALQIAMEREAKQREMEQRRWPY
jgi:D-alanyl-D-alanine carboxypeptidase (penicillin-binding protein 5/6)